MSRYISEDTRARIVNLILRVPPLFIIDYVFRESLTVTLQWSSLHICILFFLAYTFVLILRYVSKEDLLHTYRLLLAITILFVSYNNVQCVSFSSDISHEAVSNIVYDLDLTEAFDYVKPVSASVVQMVIQVFIALGYHQLVDNISSSIWEDYFGASRFSVRIILFYIPIVYQWFWSSGIVLFLLVLLPGVEIVNPLVKCIYDVPKKYWRKYMNAIQVNANGSNSMWSTISEYIHRNMTDDTEELLFFFWTVRLSLSCLLYLSRVHRPSFSIEQSGQYLFYGESIEIGILDNDRGDLRDDGENDSHTSSTAVVNIIQHILISGSETLLAILAIRVIIKIMSRKIADCLLRLACVDTTIAVNMTEYIADKTASMFALYAWTVEVWNLDATARTYQLFLSICVLPVIFTYYVQECVRGYFRENAVTNSFLKYVRALGVCVALTICSSWFVRHSGLEINSWMLAGSIALIVESIIQTIFMLLLVSFSLIDLHQGVLWGKLDDSIYMIRLTQRGISFIFQLCYHWCVTWIFIFHYCNPFLAPVIGMYAYEMYAQCMVYWKQLSYRRRLLGLINLLPEATEEKLKEYYDVCSICLVHLDSAARVLPSCKHLLHDNCLMSMIKVRNYKCPICGGIIFVTRGAPVTEPANEGDGQPQN